MQLNRAAGLLSLGLLLVLNGCGSEQGGTKSQFRILKPGAITPVAGEPFRLVGRFQAVPDPTGTGIQDRSHGSGGACIIGDLAKLGAPEKSCATNDQCNASLNQYRTDNAGNADIQKISIGGGYCVAKRCWYRPSYDSCARSSTPWPIGTHDIAPADLSHIKRIYGDEAKIDWQVVTCANHAKSNGKDAGVVGGVPETGSCAKSEGIYLPPHT